ncbi:hypothetical protein NKJ09_23180 [Mesorhizobium sp. M0189]|uniref:TAXI family TRAP transporter solute-binding subunit n=1 Tax=Mesorhizobium sp. M0189 TaxID=2956909 RepID=UPI003338B66A
MIKRLLIIAAFASMLPAAAMADIRLCTGSASGVYFAAGQEIVKMAGKNMPVTVVETEGTIDNLQRVLDLPADSPDACDAMIGQPDGPVYIGRQSPAKIKKLRQVGGLHREYLQVLCSKASGVDDLGAQPDATDINYEDAFTRGVVGGDYTINLHCYRCPQLPQEVKVVVEINTGEPGKASLKPLVNTTVKLVTNGQERTAIRFKLTDKGEIVTGSMNSVFKPLRSAEK